MAQRTASSLLLGRWWMGLVVLLLMQLPLPSFCGDERAVIAAEESKRADRSERANRAHRPPNFVVIYCDDLGYGDLGCYGSTRNPTPRLDQMAREGVRLTDFYTAAAVCSASRAALLTGCYPQRVGILGALGPNSPKGIHEDERLLPELLRERGYATAIYGKWHLGDAPQFLPARHGFQDYLGLPYSNDMWPRHPTNKTFPELPLIEGVRVAQIDPDQSQLTTWYTERACRFIEQQRDQPFFLYVPHTMPHVPLFVSERHRGKSGRGIYADVVQELDWSVGEILDTLRRTGLDEQTLVFFSSDNGPWLSYGEHAGSAGPLREGKGTTWEGGQRVPALVRWPGKIPAGKICQELSTTMDLLPTLVKLAGGELPRDRVIDGHDVWSLWTAPADARTPYDAFYYYWDYGLEAVRSGPWKLHFPHRYRTLAGAVEKPGVRGDAGKNGEPLEYQQRETGLELYHLGEDIGERQDRSSTEPEQVRRLQALAERARATLGDSLQKRPGPDRRSAGVRRDP
ncbi:MAG: sulfatase [Planctomycetota bacterium]